MPNGIKQFHDRLQDQEDAYVHHYRIARRFWWTYIGLAALLGVFVGRACL